MNAQTLALAVFFLALPSLVLAQLTPEQAQARLDARLALRAKTQPAATQSTIPPARSGQPSINFSQYPEPIKQLFYDGETKRLDRIELLNTEIKAARITINRLQQQGGRVPDVVRSKEWIELAQREIRQLHEPYTFLTEETTLPIDKDGYLCCRFKITQIIDADNLLTSGGWITGVKTAGMIDDETVTTRGLLVPERTRRFTTVLGAGRTVAVLRLTRVAPIPAVAWSYYQTVAAIVHVPGPPVDDPGQPIRKPPPEEYHQIIR